MSTSHTGSDDGPGGLPFCHCGCEHVCEQPPSILLVHDTTHRAARPPARQHLSQEGGAGPEMTPSWACTLPCLGRHLCTCLDEGWLGWRLSHTASYLVTSFTTQQRSQNTHASHSPPPLWQAPCFRRFFPSTSRIADLEVHCLAETCTSAQPGARRPLYKSASSVDRPPSRCSPDPPANNQRPRCLHTRESR